ncbi:MAG TPA: hypothetical protein VIN93_12115 [Bryobacteraceae bacterium]|jgi:hypothetical protein
MLRHRLGTGILFLLLATAAWATDITGTWKGDVSTPDGNTFTLTYTFKQDGAKLTGTVLGPQGDPLPLDNGKVDGEKISFSVKVDFNGGTTFSSEGIINGDEITLKTKADTGDMDMPPMTIKRQK